MKIIVLSSHTPSLFWFRMDMMQSFKEKGHDVVIGGELFSDAMGAEDSEEGTYIGMYKYNINSIVDALK